MAKVRPSAKQLKALEAVGQGRAQYGSEYPNTARRAAARGRLIDVRTWLLDGIGVYGAEHATWGSIEERGWIKVRTDLLSMKHVPEQTREYTSLSGSKTVKVLPAHEEPSDAGWRATVELTAEGAELLERYGERIGQSSDAGK